MVEANGALEAQLLGPPLNRAIATQLPKTSWTQRMSSGSGVIVRRDSSSLWS